MNLRQMLGVHSAHVLIRQTRRRYRRTQYHHPTAACHKLQLSHYWNTTNIHITLCTSVFTPINLVLHSSFVLSHNRITQKTTQIFIKFWKSWTSGKWTT